MSQLVPVLKFVKCFQNGERVQCRFLVVKR
jgi:hypothetical protein